MTTTNKQFIKSLALTLFLALVAFQVWQYEIFNVVGWSSTKWAYAQLYSPWLIALLTAVISIVPFYLQNQQKLDAPAILATVLLFGCGIVSYYTFQYFSLSFLFRFYEVLGIVLVNGLIFYITINQLVRKIPIFYSFAIILAIVCSIFFGFLFISNYLEMIKTGYPFFFIILNIGLASTLTARFSKQKIQAQEFEDILDNPLFI